MSKSVDGEFINMFARAARSRATRHCAVAEIYSLQRFETHSFYLFEVG